MKNRKRIIGPVVALLFLSASAGSAEEPDSRVPVIVELFTSEGCSSCPPADRLLANLLDKQPVDGVEIIGLEHHVDYWDRLGWRDPFSSNQFTARQSAYGGVFRLSSIYTPQMVVDGTHQFVGSERRDAFRAIATAGQQPKANLDVTASLSPLVDQDRRLLVRIEVADVPESAATSERLAVVLAVIEDGLESDVSRGENRGKLLRHRGVTRYFKTLGTMDPAQSPTFSQQTAVKLNPKWNLRLLKAVVFVQGSQSKRIIGAASIAVPL